MKQITRKWLKKQDVCELDWYDQQNTTDPHKLFNAALKDKKFNFINWTITRLMNKKQCVMYSVFAADLIIKKYAKEYSDDRPQKTIKAAKAYIKNPSQKTIKAARAAADEAWIVAGVADARAACAARAAAKAWPVALYKAISPPQKLLNCRAADARAAADAVRAAAWAAWAAAGVAGAADAGAACAARAARDDRAAALTKILKYGYKLLRTKAHR